MSDFLPTQEERMLRDSARSLFARPAGGERWDALAGAGFLAATLPQEAGGLGWGARAAAIVAEEMGRASADEPFVEVSAAAQALLAMSADVADIAGGTRVILAHDEAEARGEPGWIGLEARRQAGGHALHGGKQAIVGAENADIVIVSAMVPGAGPTLFRVDEAGAARRDYPLYDGRRGSDFRFDGLTLADDAIVGPVGGAGDAIARAFDHRLILSAARALGTMQAAFDLTRDYLKTRRQYGQLIGDFQALRHRLADMFIALEQARSMVMRGVAALDQDGADRSLLAAATKAKVAQAGLFVTANAIQLHGGIGVTREYPVGRLYTRMVAFENQHGPASVHVRRYAQMLAGQ